ncbi:MAG TPA: class I SAM-dependent methyltransferase [Candidatus Rifleibacterium sp.]|nr:class I SAM-dependent methyltransferase [Candidatus Rifleibacterium sp.]
MRKCDKCNLCFFDLAQGYNTAGEIYNSISPLSTTFMCPRHKTFKKMIFRSRQGRLPNILELGSGHSMLAQDLARAGCTVTVVDYEPCIEQRKYPQGGVLIPYKADLTSLKASDFSSEHFDWVILDNVLEHLPAYYGLITNIKSWIKKNPLGKVLVSVPNRLSLRNYLSPNYRKNHQYRPLEHVNMFDARSLDSLFEKRGFCLSPTIFFPTSLMDLIILLSMTLVSPFGLYRVYALNANTE